MALLIKSLLYPWLRGGGEDQRGADRAYWLRGRRHVFLAADSLRHPRKKEGIKQRNN